MMKTKSIIIFVALMVLLVGVTSASEVSDDTIDTPSTGDVSSAIMSADSDANVISDTDVESADLSESVTEIQENKKISKEEKNTKTAAVLIDVNNFNALNSTLTSDTYSDVTINILSNIELGGNIVVHQEIKTLNIEGNGKTINGNNEYRFLYINGSTVTINKLNIINCTSSQYGGAIYKEVGNLTITKSNFTNCHVKLYGGAIYSLDNRIVTINESNFKENRAKWGGAIISNKGNTTIINSNFTDNHASDRGGAVYVYGGIVNITDSNLTDNHAGNKSGAIFNAANLIITNSTLKHNNATDGGAIGNTGFLTITDSNITENRADQLGGAIINYRYLGIAPNVIIINSNITKNNATGGGAIFSNATINITDVTLKYNKASYQGGAIYNNGTLSINISSLNNNNVSSFGGAIFNYGTLSVSASTFENNRGSFGGAIDNSVDGSLIINGSSFYNNNGSWGGAIYNYYSEANITNVTFSYNKATLGGAYYNERALSILNNTTFINNNATDGGAIYNYYEEESTTKSSGLNDIREVADEEETLYSDIYIIDSKLKNNYAKNDGGAIYAMENTFTNISLSEFDNNTAERYDGGAIYNGGILHITDSTLSNNNAKFDGGAISNSNNAYLNASNTSFTYNHAEMGGALYSGSRISILNNTTFAYNRADSGGAIYNDYHFEFGSDMNRATSTGLKEVTEDEYYINEDMLFNLYIIDSKLNNNTAEYDGGALYNEGDLLIYGSELTNNNVSLYGGAIENKGIMAIEDSTLTDNKAIKAGSAIFNHLYLFINNSTLNDNLISAMGYDMSEIDEMGEMNFDGGAAIFNIEGCVIVNNTTINNNNVNRTNASGGAIYNCYGYISINITHMEKNMVKESGGAIYNNYGKIIVCNATINNNTANAGGAIYNNVTEDIIVGPETKNMKAEPADGKIVFIDDEIEYIESVDILINDTNFTDNHAENGGAIYNENGTVNITKSIFTNNTATTGSAISNYANATIHNNTFISNKANMEKSAIIDVPDTATIENNIHDDTSIFYGTIYTDGYAVTITNNIFDDGIVNTTITITTNNSKPTVNDTIEIKLLLQDQNNNNVSGQNITLTIDGTPHKLTTANNGTTTYKHTLTSNMTHVTAKFEGNYPYNKTNATLDITAKKINTKLTLNVSNSTPLNNTPVTITAILNDAKNNNISSQDITLNIAGKTVTIKTNSNGTATYMYTPTKVEEQTITATYKGNSQYSNSTKTSSITVKKLNTTLTIKVSNSTPLNNTPVNITVTLKDANGRAVSGENVTLSVGGNTFTVKTDASGVAVQAYTPTKVESQTVKATFNGNSQLNSSTTSTTITVKKLNTKLTVGVSNQSPVLNTSINITVTLKDANGMAVSGENVTLTVGGKTFTVKTDASGVALQAYTPTKVENQTIAATYKGNSQLNNATASTTISVKKINTKLTIKVSNSTPVNNTPINITVTLKDANNKNLSGQNLTLKVGDKTFNLKTNANGTVTQAYAPVKVETLTITATYKGSTQYNGSTKSTNITVRNKYNTKTVVNTANGTIGEKLVLKATVTDQNNAKVNDGNLIFKINGVTIKDNGKLSGSDNPLKVKVVNGVATATIIPDVTMKSAQTITASYVGTDIYNKSTSNPANIKISLRNASIEITTNVKKIKQGQVLTITAKVYDTTNGKKSTNLTKFDGEYVYFKVNGITLKDENNQTIKVKLVNGVATVNYTVPLGIACIMDCNSMAVKNHTIIAGYYNNNYNTTSQTATFQVERSNLTLEISNVTANNRTHKLSLKVTVKDYLGNVVAGPNKFIIKLNGLSITNGTQAMYYYSVDGILTISNIDIPVYNKYNNLEVVTQDRLAYTSQRNTTTKIRVLN